MSDSRTASKSNCGSAVRRGRSSDVIQLARGNKRASELLFRRFAVSSIESGSDASY